MSLILLEREALTLRQVDRTSTEEAVNLFRRLRLLAIAGLAHLHVKFRFGMVSQRGRVASPVSVVC